MILLAACLALFLVSHFPCALKASHVLLQSPLGRFQQTYSRLCSSMHVSSAHIFRFLKIAICTSEETPGLNPNRNQSLVSSVRARSQEIRPIAWQHSLDFLPKLVVLPHNFLLGTVAIHMVPYPVYADGLGRLSHDAHDMVSQGRLSPDVDLVDVSKLTPGARAFTSANPGANLCRCAVTWGPLDFSSVRSRALRGCYRGLEDRLAPGVGARGSGIEAQSSSAHPRSCAPGMRELFQIVNGSDGSLSCHG